MTDADVDGAHIRTLLLTFFYRQMTPLINNGYIYIAQPPLYKVKKNKKEMYLHTDDQLDKFLFAEGMSGVEFFTLKAGKQSAAYEEKKFSQIIQNLNELDNLVKKLEKKARLLERLYGFQGTEKAPSLPRGQPRNRRQEIHIQRQGMERVQERVHEKERRLT